MGIFPILKGIRASTGPILASAAFHVESILLVTADEGSTLLDILQASRPQGIES